MKKAMSDGIDAIYSEPDCKSEKMTRTAFLLSEFREKKDWPEVVAGFDDAGPIGSDLANPTQHCTIRYALHFSAERIMNEIDHQY